MTPQNGSHLTILVYDCLNVTTLGKAFGRPWVLCGHDRPTDIVWFRDDLRLSDHPALHAAGPRPVSGLYVLDPESRTPEARPLGGAANCAAAEQLIHSRKRRRSNSQGVAARPIRIRSSITSGRERALKAYATIRR